MTLLPEGFRDRLPPHADAAADAVARMLEVARLHGYERVAPPVAEFAEGLAGRLKSAEPRDLARFTDPVSQRTLALRPDITAQVGRIAATRMAHHPRPLRLSYAGQVVKLRASQLRPDREQSQVGCELVGLDSVAAAREIVGIAIGALEAAGIGGITLDFTMPDAVDALAAGPLPLADIDATRARLDAKDAGALTGDAAAYLPLLAAAGPFDQALERLHAFDTAGALESRLAGIAAVAQAAAGRATLTLDPTERHGFEYQTWLGFSLFADGAAGEVGRGGSYAIMGEAGEEPAVGFSLYLDPLIDAGLATAERRRLFVPHDAAEAEAMALRAAGWVTVRGLTTEDTAAAQLCTHVLVDGAPQQV